MRAFPAVARSIAGFQLLRIQRGLEPSDWKPMSSIGPGVQEIRIHTEVERRICYVARFAEGIYVLHAFDKRTRATAARDLELARGRYRALLARRREEGHGRG